MCFKIYLPYSKKKRRSESTSYQVVTPVRRSTRRSLQNLPESLKDTKPSFSNIDDIEEPDNLLFQTNMALQTMLDTVEDEVEGKEEEKS